MKNVYLHNPRCSKSRSGLALLKERGVEITVREYLKDTPTAADLTRITGLLGIRPVELCRTSEDVYRSLGISDKTPDADVIRMMAENPILMERPILVIGERAVIGRPTEKLLELL